MQNLTHSEPQHRGTNLKGHWSYPLADLGEAPREEGGNWEHRCWQQPFWGPCSTTVTLGLANTILESSLESVSAGGLPAHQRAGSSPRTPPGCAASHTRPQPPNTSKHKAGPGSQPSQGPTSPTSTSTVARPATTKEPT